MEAAAWGARDREGALVAAGELAGDVQPVGGEREGAVASIPCLHPLRGGTGAVRRDEGEVGEVRLRIGPEVGDRTVLTGLGGPRARCQRATDAGAGDQHQERDGQGPPAAAGRSRRGTRFATAQGALYERHAGLTEVIAASTMTLAT